MAYNLQPLISILEGILDPDQSRWIVDDNNSQLQSLLDKATSLQHLLDQSSLTKIDSLECQIREIAHQAENILESYMVDHMRSNRFNDVFCLNPPTWLIKCIHLCSPSITFSSPDLQQVARDLDSVMEQVEKLIEMEDNKMPLELDSAMEQVKLVDKKMPSSSSSSSVVVGIDADLRQLKDRLTRLEKKLEIVPIVGMGGVGKTTLARKLYEDPLIVCYFAYRAWTTISQDYNMPQILLSLLSCIIKREEFDQHKHKGMHELKDILYKSLYGRKYLIVLDDIWSTKFWDEMRMYFPDNNNGSRVVITTRESDVANYADSLSSHHQVQLLSESKSWNLLHQLVFGEEECPLVLQEIGRKIAKGCGGLPLAISVIGGLLSKMDRSDDVWRKIGDNVIAAISGSDERCYSILSLSYKHLPNHLKPCFLYMGAYPEDYMIKGSMLAYMWVAEGFIKSNGEKSLEEEAKDCLKSLVERNLFLVRQYECGKPKSYGMHDMLRDLCIRKCAEDKFLYVKKDFKVTLSNPRRMISHMSNGINDVSTLTRSVVRIGFTGYVSLSSLLRVLDLLDMDLDEFPTDVFELINLHFLGVNCKSSIPRGISRLWNLQTLIYSGDIGVPSELWNLSKLRNVKVHRIELLKDEKMNYRVLKMMQKISTVILSEKASTSDGFFKSIPNIISLTIDDDLRRTSTTFDLSHLHKLEILRCKRIIAIDSPGRSLVIFPCHIRKLVLDLCVINSGVLRTLRAMHKLEVLTIISCIFASDELTHEEEWELADGDVFCSLQFLYLKNLYIRSWIADETNFPTLRHLCVHDCRELEEIPSSIGEIPTLQLIELEECTKSAVASAKRIEEEQFENGNYDIKLRIINTLDR